MKKNRSDWVFLVINSCDSVKDQFGHFTRKEAFGKVMDSISRSATFNKVFNELVEAGEIVLVGGTLYKLKDSVVKAMKTKEVTHTLKVVDATKIILEYLNSAIGSKFKPNEKTKSLVSARMREGHKIDDFKIVIDKKVSDWRGTKYEPYLRPITLFSTKFESYLNQETKRTRIENMDFDKFFS
jgi:uncharacterized phage protein (TIGR02220 family)